MPKHPSLFVWLVLIALSTMALAQAVSVDPSDQSSNQRIDAWNQALDEVERDLAAPGLRRARIRVLLEETRGIRQDVLDMSESAASRATTARRLLAALGPAPAAGEPGEDQSTLGERRRIEAQITEYESRYKRCQLILARIDILIEDIAVVEEAIILRVMKEHLPLPIGQVSVALSQLGNRIESIRQQMVRDWDAATPRQAGRMMGLGMLFLLGLVGVLVLRTWLRGHYGRDTAVPTPDRHQKLKASATEFLANGIIPVGFIVVMFMAVQYELLWSSGIKLLINTLLVGALQWVLLISAASMVLAPRHPGWRLNSLGDAAAAGLFRGLWWLLFVSFLLKLCGVVLDPTLSGSAWILSEDIIFTFFASQQQAAILLIGTGLLLASLLTLWILQPRHWRFIRSCETTETTTEEPPHLPLRIVLWLARLTIVGCLLLGLSGYMGAALLTYVRVCWTLVMLGLVWSGYRLIGESLLLLSASDSRSGAWLRRRMALDDVAVDRLLFWLQLLINSVVSVTTFILLLLIWGVPSAYLERLSALFFDGFAIGGILISPITIGSALVVFVGLLAMVRFVRNFLSNRVLVQTRLDVGLRDALSTVSGYIGVFVAALVALSVLGIDFGKVVLVLGGLSIGIGLGLQHIVNNFLSGLILLFQRPIKAGDWVVVGDFQGYVKRIDVIATEIETFDNASVLVPNSKMASTEVLNWTHRSKLGRVIVTVGVSYDADVEQVREILLACAEAHPDILGRPEPRVLFQNFGDSALEFDVRFYIREIDNLLRIASEMRFAIRKAFAEAGIVIPFPQHDVHLRRLED